MTRLMTAEGGRRKAEPWPVDPWAVEPWAVGSGRKRSRSLRLTPHRSPLTPHRRGVILLVVLALLSLFTLMLITFVIVTAHFRISAKGLSKVEQTGDPPDALMHSAFLQIVRGPRNPASVLGAHGLLEDMYGNRPVRARVVSSSISGIGNGQIVHFTAQITLNTGDLDPTDGFYNGRLLTFVDGPASGRSTRIVGSGTYASGNPSTMQFDVLAAPGLGISASNPLYMNFIINGRPFSGTGFGFRLSSFGTDTKEVNNLGMPADTRGPLRLLDAIHDDGSPAHLYALLPNHSSVAFHANVGTFNPYTDPAGPGGANEDYDAADFQNMLLAVRTFSATGVEQVPLPSLHRPDLVNYWVKKLSSGTWQNLPPEIRRGAILRPLTLDHPLFTGSNPSFDAINGPWDVDNDGEGTADSIWVDLGMPVQTAPDGRTYKPLFAILCIDLDGKLNLNAHGNLTHMDLAAGKFPNRFTPITGPLAVAANATAQTSPGPVLRAGQGLGPPEISLHHLFTGFANEYLNLLTGLSPPSSSLYLDGRYGEVERNIAGGYRPGPGMSRICDPLAWVMQADQPQLVNTLAYPHSSKPFGMSPPFSPPVNPAGYTGQQAFSSYGTPPDLDADGMLALDLRGQPLYLGYTGGAGWGEVDERVDSPYELDLSLNGRHAGFSSNERFGQMGAVGVGSDMNGKVSSVDAPFTASELERLLRYNDVDAAGLPDRLLRLAPHTFGNPAANLPGSPKLRNLVTYGSFDLPVPSMVFTSPEMMKDVFALAGGTKRPALFDANITQLLRARLIRNGIADGSPAMQTAMKQLLWPELVMGVKMDLNRPLGNGNDDNGNGVVDEAEAPSGTGAENEYSAIGTSASNPLDLNNDGTRDTPVPLGPDRRARQLLARHLYVLMMLLVDENPNLLRIDINGTVGDDTPRETARAIAQWAINMVDFRDRDAIMTPFEFDLFPFQDNDPNIPGTWDVDDIVGPQATPSPDDNEQTHSWRGLAWGVERPELVISETIAFHDRKTEDLATNKKTTDPTQPDPTFDSEKKPVGSLFIELFNPNSPLEPTPAEFAPAVGQAGIDLAKRNAPNSGSPVWRLAITNKPANQNDPMIDLDTPINPPAASQIERTVYFIDADPSTFTPPITGGQAYYMNKARPQYQKPAPVLPNRYAVIGPAPQTLIGERSAAPQNDLTQTRRIVLKQDSLPNTPKQVEVHNYDPANPEPAAANVKPAVALIVDLPHRLSVTEPISGYAGVDPNTGLFNPILDTPPDYANPDLKMNGTTIAYRAIHLQRLANPLLRWDAKSNPYLTVDSAPIDLTAFNGVTNDIEPGVTTVAAKIKFATRERGEYAKSQGSINELWPQEPQQKLNGVPSVAETPINHYFQYPMKNTLGYVNRDFWPYWTAGAAPVGAAPVAGFYPSGITAAEYVGDPHTAFPWLTWNNRPYASAMELGLVPATRSSKLFSGDATSSIHFALNGTKQSYDESGNYGVYPHLVNLFHSQGSGVRGSPHLYRLLEYLQVPSKFAGTETWFAPSQFGAGTGSHTFHPPFNHVSNFRDPGRININTIFDQTGVVWGGILDSLNATDPVVTIRQNRSALSRQGYGTAPYQMNPSFPTMFAKPFRSYGGNTLVPLASMRDPSGPGKEIDSTLLRPESATSNKPLFDFTSAATYNQTNRNPYFRYQELNRLSNMVTTRSNVYAIWITVGYFEVKYNTVGAGGIDPQHPDGYELGAELGSDTGDIQRHRSFYIYDRSIPVGFQRGENHNVEDGIMVQRFIE